MHSGTAVDGSLACGVPRPEGAEDPVECFHSLIFCRRSGGREGGEGRGGKGGRGTRGWWTAERKEKKEYSQAGNAYCRIS